MSERSLELEAPFVALAAISPPRVEPRVVEASAGTEAGREEETRSTCEKRWPPIRIVTSSAIAMSTAGTCIRDLRPTGSAFSRIFLRPPPRKAVEPPFALTIPARTPLFLVAILAGEPPVPSRYWVVPMETRDARAKVVLSNENEVKCCQLLPNVALTAPASVKNREAVGSLPSGIAGSQWSTVSDPTSERPDKESRDPHLRSDGTLTEESLVLVRKTVPGERCRKTRRP